MKKYRVTMIEFNNIDQKERNAIDFANYTKVSLKMRNVNLWKYKSTLTSLFFFVNIFVATLFLKNLWQRNKRRMQIG